MIKYNIGNYEFEIDPADGVGIIQNFNRDGQDLFIHCDINNGVPSIDQYMLTNSDGIVLAPLCNISHSLAEKLFEEL